MLLKDKFNFSFQFYKLFHRFCEKKPNLYLVCPMSSTFALEIKNKKFI